MTVFVLPAKVESVVMGVFIMLITVFSIAWPGRRYCTARAVFCRRAGCKRGTLSEKFALKNISVI